MKSPLFFCALLGAFGCASLPPRIPAEADPSNPLAASPRALADAAHALLAAALTPETAARVALARNQGLAAAREELALAEAEVQQAGLIKNPTVSGRLGFASGGRTADSLGVGEDFLQLLTLPSRKRLANFQFEAAKAQLASAEVELSARVKAAVIALQAAQATSAVKRLMLEAQELAAELRRRQRKAGNVSELELLTEESFAQQGRLELVRAELQESDGRELVNRLLGLFGEESALWKVESRLPDLPEADPDLASIESQAVAHRQDLAASAHQAQALEEAFSAANLARAIPSLRAGVSTEKDAEGTRTFGPTLELELPLFDQGSGPLARLTAQVRQARARQAELALFIRSEARSLRSRLTAARKVAESYRTGLLPLRERMVEEAQLKYNSALLGVFQLLLARREQGDAYRDYLASVRDYWTTRAELERATGGALAMNPTHEEKKR